MSRPTLITGLTLCLLDGFAVGKEWLSGIVWEAPPVVTPGDGTAPPSDAVVLFDGRNLDQWAGGDQWVVENGHAIAAKGGIHTKEAFGDCQLHIEWATPAEVSGSGQGRGNSGVFLQGMYEVQVLDSYENQTYHDGQAGALYKTMAPMVNASRKPGEWQTYDIIFRGARFDAHGTLLKPAYITVLHNGVLVQDHLELLGETLFTEPPTYKPHPERGPISLQFHGNPVRYRNIWIREIPPSKFQRPG
jgi:hypothetical protein